MTDRRLLKQIIVIVILFCGCLAAQTEALIRASGYRMPPGTMSVRLVHLLDEQKRKELMIIYTEDLAPAGLSAADLQKGGKAYDRWPAIEKGLIERAKGKIAIAEIAKP